MTDANAAMFEKRLKRINSGAHLTGAVAREQARRGLIVGKRRRQRSFKAPWRSLLMFAAFFVGMKAALMNDLGTEAYMTKVREISAREGVEGWAGRLMAPDLLTIYARDRVGPALAKIADLI